MTAVILVPSCPPNTCYLFKSLQQPCEVGVTVRVLRMEKMSLGEAECLVKITRAG